MKPAPDFEQLKQSVDEVGMYVERETHGFSVFNVDLVFPFIIGTLCLRGEARALYDMQEMVQRPNDFGFIMPGHVMHPISCSEDFIFTRVIVSAKMFNDIQAQVFGNDAEKYHKAPMCHLTDEQAERLLVIIDQMDFLTRCSEEELPQRNQLLKAQLAVGQAMLNLFRSEQDRQWAQDRRTALFSSFSELVVEHYRESREVKYYAELLHLSPKHFTKLIRIATGGISPAEWIEQYVVTQAKQRMKADPKRTIQQISYDLGFCEPTAFHHFFKRVTGITAKEYKAVISENSGRE